jgi:hypothetical protein
LCEQYRSLSSSLCSFRHSPVTSSLLGQIFPSTPYSQTPSAYVPPSMWATKFHTHISPIVIFVVNYHFSPRQAIRPGWGWGLMLPMVTKWQQFNFMTSFTKPGCCVMCTSLEQPHVTFVVGSIWREEEGKP